MNRFIRFSRLPPASPHSPSLVPPIHYFSVISPSAALMMPQLHQSLIFLRGPIIFFASVIGIILPILLTSNVGTIICVTLLGIGLFVSLWDLWSWCENDGIRLLKRQIVGHAQGLILDQLIRDLNACYTNAVGAVMGVLGIIGLYNINIDDADKSTLLQPFLPPGEDANEVLFSKGGILRIIPKEWQNVDDDDDGDEKNNDVEFEISTQITTSGAASPHVTNEFIMKDMHWVNDTDKTNDTDYYPSSISKDAATATAVVVDLSDTASASGEASLDGNDDALPSSSHNNNNNNNTLSKRPQQQPPSSITPVDELTSIIMNMILTKTRQKFMAINKSSLTLVGATASLSLLAQMRSSRTARTLLKGAYHGIGMITLSSTMGGVALVLMMIRQEQQQQHSLYVKDDDDDDDDCSFEMTDHNNERQSRRNMVVRRRQQSTFITRFCNKLSSQISYLLRDVMMDGRGQKRLRHLLALILLLSVGHKMRLRRKRLKWS